MYTNYYVEQGKRYKAASEELKKASRAYWTRIHAKNVKTWAGGLDNIFRADFISI